MCEKMVADLVARWRGCKTIGGKNVWKIEEKVGDTLWGGEESCSERRRWRRQRGKAQGRRRAAKNLLVGHLQKNFFFFFATSPWELRLGLYQPIGWGFYYVL